MRFNLKITEFVRNYININNGAVKNIWPSKLVEGTNVSQVFAASIFSVGRENTLGN